MSFVWYIAQIYFLARRFLNAVGNISLAAKFFFYIASNNHVELKVCKDYDAPFRITKQ